MDIGFPELTDSFLEGQDIFYVQFNDVYFYVEDTDQEHLYFNILKRLFNNVTFNKIFPLNGKENLKNHARNNVGNKDRIYIADIDFEDILETKEELANVFYLNKYSIENHLVDQAGLFELVREKSPKLKDSDISNLFDLNTSLRQCKAVLTELACTFIVIQKYSLANFSKNVPGKSLLKVLKYQLEKAGLIIQMSLETFTYKLSKEGNLSSFELLKNEITVYRK